MEREACVCDHGLERSDLCAGIIIRRIDWGWFLARQIKFDGSDRTRNDPMNHDVTRCFVPEPDHRFRLFTRLSSDRKISSSSSLPGARQSG